MLCVKCGKELADGVGFCRFCGSPQMAGGTVPGGGPASAGAGRSPAIDLPTLSTQDYIIVSALIAIALLLVLIFAVS
ncbi:MAG: zinc ribbon domain-containing protein [Actinobacteria bacterium]|nr:zinc ribbon domain-containing protein [Actinomycetota bacterium]